MKKIVKVIRTQQDSNQTLGFLQVEDGNNTPLYADVCLERGWQNNKKSVSCIPEGTYTLKKEWSPRFSAMLWEIYGVPGRSECKFHAANFWRQLNGCIAPGVGTADIDGDGYIDVLSSRASLDRFDKAMGDAEEAILIVKSTFSQACKNTL